MPEEKDKPTEKEKPTEKDKKEKEQSWEQDSKMMIKGKEISIKLQVNTKPNAKGGYDTIIKLPVSPLGAAAK